MTSGLVLEVNGQTLTVPDDGASLMEVLRDRLGIKSVKDGCSPQGQCGCCTVLIDGKPRVSCVTPARRVVGRAVTTVEGLAEEERTQWGDAFTACGASQCGFCTPGIIVRLEALRRGGTGADDKTKVDRALGAHLCRCTGWNTITEAYAAFGEPADRSRNLEAASVRAGLEGGIAQAVNPAVALGAGGFADDAAPEDALVAVPGPTGDWVVAPTLTAARAASGKVQGRRTTHQLQPPLDLPAGSWDATLRTVWVDPAYLETDASWCAPGGEPASPLGNGGAFGGKVHSEVAQVARRLADEHGQAVRVLLPREEVVRRGPKRPPVAGGATASGSGELRIVRTPGVAAAIERVAPDLVVTEIDVPGPPTSAEIRAAGWAEAVVLLAGAAGWLAPVEGPDGGVAEASVTPDGIHVAVDAGDPLDETVLRSYCIGAAHMAYSWVTSEGLATDGSGAPLDLTLRSLGVLRAQDMPPVEVEIRASDRRAVKGSDAVFAAVAAATWLSRDCPSDWPIGLR